MSVARTFEVSVTEDRTASISVENWRVEVGYAVAIESLTALLDDVLHRLKERERQALRGHLTLLDGGA